MKKYIDDLISVITPTYNSEKFIKDTIESVINQTYLNWEMIIVDDVSNDKTKEIIKKYQQIDERIHLIELDENGGAGVARNIGMDYARGRYIAFLDSDDQWLPQKLEKQINFMQENNYEFTFTAYRRVLENGSPLHGISETPESVGYEDLMKHCVIGCLTVIIDRKVIGDERMPTIRTRQDYAFWLQLTKKGHRAFGLNEELSLYRLVDGSISSNKLKAAKQNFYLYYNIEKQSLLKSLWYFTNYAFKSIKKIIRYKLS